MRIDQILKKLRKEKGWTQEDLAERLNISPAGYAKIERGETEIKISRLVKIAEIFGISVIDFFPQELCQPNRTEPNRTEPNRTEPNRTEPNRTEPNRTDKIVS